jgi:hypothetical protein
MFENENRGICVPSLTLRRRSLWAHTVGFGLDLEPLFAPALHTLLSRPDCLPLSFDLLRFELESLALPLPRLAPACCFGVCVSCAPTDCHAVVVVESPTPRIDAAAAIVVSPRRRIIMVIVIGFA